MAKEYNGEVKILTRLVYLILGGIVVIGFVTAPALGKLDQVANSVGDNRNAITKNEVKVENNEKTLSEIKDKLDKIWNKLK